MMWLKSEATATFLIRMQQSSATTNLRKLDLVKPVTDLGSKPPDQSFTTRISQLYGTNVSDSSVTLLAEIPHLRELYLWQTKIGDTTMESVEESKGSTENF